MVGSATSSDSVGVLPPEADVRPLDAGDTDSQPLIQLQIDEQVHILLINQHPL